MLRYQENRIQPFEIVYTKIGRKIEGGSNQRNPDGSQTRLQVRQQSKRQRRSRACRKTPHAVHSQTDKAQKMFANSSTEWKGPMCVTASCCFYRVRRQRNCRNKPGLFALWSPSALVGFLSRVHRYVHIFWSHNTVVESGPEGHNILAQKATR